ncbi:MAG TPA: AAA family ATPase [Frankiaceae bacterium]|nr:AAA family ATPase [Frankiaceae bacterium]
MAGEERLVGRDDALARLRDALARAAAGTRAVVLVAGPAGIGKTALVRAAVRDEALVGWGTCVDDAGAPGYWPWTRAIETLVRLAPDAPAPDDAPLLATIAPAFGPARGGAGERDRLLLMDGVGRWLERLAADRPVVVVLDDLQWADESSLALLELVARSPEPARLTVVGCYRRDELTAGRRDRLARLASAAGHVELAGLDRAAVAALAAAVAGPLPPDAVDALYRRAGGHPVFTRELALLPAGAEGALPSAVRDAIDQRVRLLPEATQRAVEVAALAGNDVYADVVAAVTGTPVAELADVVEPALEAGLLVRDAAGQVRFSHDLYRETLAARASPAARPALHAAIGAALEARLGRGGEVSAAETARHFTAAVSADGSGRAARWALAAAARDVEALAFTEAVVHLRRWRAAVADAAADVADEDLVAVLLTEADALTRSGAGADARGLLRVARDVAVRARSATWRADVALAVAGLGAVFAARRDESVRELEAALDAVAGVDPAREARVAAALARALQHSVAEDRPRAGPLSERALGYARTAGDPETLHACLLARHDVLWTPGAAAERVAVAQELVEVAGRVGDDERRAQALLLLANALLETGSAAFRPALEECLALLDRLGQPPHRYVTTTRRAALALLAGELDAAEAAIEEAATLGRSIREPDVDNVRMSQRLELVRARGDAAELAAFATAAVAHWTGAPVHAHGVAAGYLARAGDVEGARRHAATVVDLGTWRSDRSYLWSVFVRELAVAAVTLGDTGLCAELLADVEPVAGSCGVNGAVVAFAGSHAETAGLLAAAVGRDGAGYLADAEQTYARLGATAWTRATVVTGPGGPALRRAGSTWEVSYAGARATLPHAKGLADLATLIAAPGKDVHVLDLYGAGVESSAAGEVADRTALAAYRQRLADLDAEINGAADQERRAGAVEERAALVAELGRVAKRGGGGRSFANYPTERARKAVTGRIRDTIRRLEAELPALAAHLDRSVATGTWCRYRPE